MVANFGDRFDGKKSGGFFGGMAGRFGKKSRKDDKRRKALRAVFEAMDEDGGGSIDYEEFRHAMTAMAADGKTAPPPEEELRKAFDDVDDDGGGSVDFDEFVQMIDAMHSTSASSEGGAKMNSLFVKAAARIGREQKEKAKLRGIFEAMDEDGSGDIDYDEFKVAMEQMDPKQVPADDELRKAFDGVDEDGGGSISFDEFVEMFRQLKSGAGGKGGGGAGLFARATGRFSMFKKKKKKQNDRGSDASSSDSSDSDSGDDIFGMGFGDDDEDGGKGMGGGMEWMMGGDTAGGGNNADDDESNGSKGKGKGKSTGKARRGSVLPAPPVKRTVFVKMNASAADIIALTKERRAKEGRFDADQLTDGNEDEENDMAVGDSNDRPEPYSEMFLAFAEEAIAAVPVSRGRGISFRSSRRGVGGASSARRLAQSPSFKRPREGGPASSTSGSPGAGGSGVGSSPPTPSRLALGDGALGDNAVDQTESVTGNRDAGEQNGEIKEAGAVDGGSDEEGDEGVGDGSGAEAVKAANETDVSDTQAMGSLLASLDDMDPAKALISFCPVKIRQRFHPLDNHAERTARDAMRCILVYMNQQGDMYSATTGSAPSHHHCIEVAGKMLTSALCEPEDVWDEIYCECYTYRERNFVEIPSM